MGWEASPGARTTLDSEGVYAYQAPNLCVCVKEKKDLGHNSKHDSTQGYRKCQQHRAVMLVEEMSGAPVVSWIGSLMGVGL